MTLDAPGWLSGAVLTARSCLGIPRGVLWPPREGPPLGQHAADLSWACLPGTRPQALSPCSPLVGWAGGPVCLVGWSVTQPEMHTSEWRNVAARLNEAPQN